MLTEINFPKLHDGQREIAEHPARFRVLAAGRRWGKSRLGSALCVAEGLSGGRAWWIAPSYPVANVGWRMIKKLADPIPNVKIRLADRAVLFEDGGEVRVRSADNPDSLRGEGLDLAVLDECAFMKQEAWTEALRPALTDRQGRAVFISTPKGREWFWQLWQRGRDDKYPDWQSWQLPTSANPFIPDDEIEAAFGQLPERIYQQEYLAEFLSDAGEVFRNIMKCNTAEPQDLRVMERDQWHRYVIGVDLAKHNDFTVFSVIDINTQEQVYLDRDNRVDLTVQLSRLKALNERFKPAMNVIEVNFNEMFAEQARLEGLPVYEFRTTNATKQKAVEDLAMAFERGAIKILNDPVQIGELQAFEMDRTPSGMVRYSAPEGLHDDTVIALALAWQGAARRPGPMITQPEQPSRWAPIRGNNGGGRWGRFK